MTGHATGALYPDRAVDRRLLHRWLPLALVAAACLLPLGGLWRAPGAPMEEGFMLTFPELVLKGFVPHEDFLHLYGPGGLWLLAGVYRVFGVALEVERVVGFLQQAAVAFGVFAALRPWGRWVAAVAAVVTAVIVIPPIGLTALAWVGAVALGLWSINATLGGVTRDDRRLVGLGGVLGGLALLWRPDLAVAVGLSGVVLLTSLRGRTRWWYLGGAAAGVSPYLVLVAMAGLGDVIEGLFLQPVFDLRGGRRLPLPPSWDHFDGFLQLAGLLEEPPWPFPAPASPAQLSLWLLLLAASVVVLFVAGRGAARRTGDRRLVALALFSAGLLPQALQRADSTHLAWVGCVAFAVLPAALIELARAFRPAQPRPSWRRSVPAVLLVGVLLLTVAPWYTYRSYAEMTAKTFGARRQEEVIRHGGREFPYKRLDAVAAVREMLPVVDATTEPGDRLVVGPGDLRKTPYSEAFLYFLLPDLVPGTRFIEMDPGVANAEDSGLADEIAAADVVILSTIRDDWHEPNDSLLFGPDEPNDVLAREFCLEGSFGDSPFYDDRGLYELYLRC
jgi:hypothetical protein